MLFFPATGVFLLLMNPIDVRKSKVSAEVNRRPFISPRDRRFSLWRGAIQSSMRFPSFPQTQTSLWLETRSIPLHCGPQQPRIQTEVLGQSLIRSHRSLVSLLRIARFVCAHSFALFACFICSLTLLTPKLVGW